MSKFMCRTCLAVALALVGPASTGRHARAGDGPGRGPDVPERLGLERSAKHRNLVAASVELTNNLLSLDTSYRLALDPAPAGSVPVFLVSGAGLDADTTAFVPGGERCVVINTDLIARVVRRFGFAYDDAHELNDPHPQFGIFPEADDRARKVLALVLMHEVGHIWVSDHGHYTGTHVAAFDEIMAAAGGGQKRVELEADKFCADRIRMANLTLLIHINDHFKYIDMLDRFVAARRMGQSFKARVVSVDQIRAATDFADFVFLANAKVNRNGYLAGRDINPSHVDLDLRLGILFIVGYGLDDAATNLITWNLEDRQQQGRYMIASQELKSEFQREPVTDPYFFTSRLLRHPDIGVRIQSAKLLRQEAEKTPLKAEILPDLLAGLRRKHGEVPHVGDVLSAMGRLASSGVVECLRDENPEVRLDAIACLLRMHPTERGTSAVFGLCECLSDRISRVYVEALVGLLEMESEERKYAIAALLMAAADSSKDKSVREMALLIAWRSFREALPQEGFRGMALLIAWGSLRQALPRVTAMLCTRISGILAAQPPL